MKSKLFLSILSVPFLASLTFAQVAWNGSDTSPNHGQPLTGTPWTLYATGADVKVSVRPFQFFGNPGQDAWLYVSDNDGAVWNFVGTMHNTVAVLDLGNVAAGTEILFRMPSTVTGLDLYSGSLTPLSTDAADGVNHADIYQAGADGIVDFEDQSLAHQSDWNYGDATLEVTNVTAQAVPEPSALAIVGFGLAGVMIRRRRK